MSQPSEFKAVFSNTIWSDSFYRFLQVIFHLYPEEKFHHFISATSREKSTDEDIYKTVQLGLPKIKPFLSELTLALPALKKQKKEMARQVLQLLGDRKNINGYLEMALRVATSANFASISIFPGTFTLPMILLRAMHWEIFLNGAN